jgi:hypothetical protein
MSPESYERHPVAASQKLSEVSNLLALSAPLVAAGAKTNGRPAENSVNGASQVFRSR